MTYTHDTHTITLWHGFQALERMRTMTQADAIDVAKGALIHHYATMHDAWGAMFDHAITHPTDDNDDLVVTLIVDGERTEFFAVVLLIYGTSGADD